jgi:predicted Zn-dependent protease
MDFRIGINLGDIIHKDDRIYGDGVNVAARLKDFGGEQEAVELFERAMRLSPKHPWWVPCAYGVALHLVGRKEDAVVSLRNAISLKPENPQPYAFLAAVYADLRSTG